MFEFKKSMKGVPKKEDFECECCGLIEDESSTPSGCTSGCASTVNSCCGSEPEKEQNTTNKASSCSENFPKKPQQTESCCNSSSKGSCCG
jgi:hypothetical protein